MLDRLASNTFQAGLPLAVLALLSSPSTLAESAGHGDPYRFLFCSDKHVLLELSQDYYEEVADLEQLGEQPIPWSWVKESEGDRYAAYVFKGGVFQTVKLESLARIPSGDGGIAGIAGVVDWTPKRANDCCDYWVIGVTYGPPSENKPLQPGKPTALPRSLRKALGNMGGKFKGSCSRNSGTGASIALVKQHISEGRVIVRVFYLAGQQYTELAFPDWEFRVEKSLLIHDPTGETDVTPHNGTLTVLPDFDANGYPEFLIDGTATALFAVEGAPGELPKILRKRRLYFGP